jgi:hypothetical protein
MVAFIGLASEPVLYNTGEVILELASKAQEFQRFIKMTSTEKSSWQI